MKVVRSERMRWAQGVSSSSRSTGPHLPKEGDAGEKSRAKVLIAAGVVAAGVAAWKWIRRKKNEDEAEAEARSRTDTKASKDAKETEEKGRTNRKQKGRTVKGESRGIGVPKSIAAGSSSGNASLPRNKRANNKKNKARKAEKKKIKWQKKEIEKGAHEETTKTTKEAKAEHKAIEEMDEKGKTFVTTQQWTMPEKYARQGRRLMEE